MWPPTSIDLESVDIVLDHSRIQEIVPKFEPNPYTFTKIENGRKTAADSTSLIPPSWLLLDHTIAVVWSLFNLSSTLQQLSIDDLKWAYEFLKRIKNKKGENPPDVKVCLKEIQDRLINLYAKLTSLKDEDFDEIAAAFGEKIIEDSTTSYFNTSFTANAVESKFDTISNSETKLSLVQRQSSKDITKPGSGKRSMNFSRNSFPTLEEDSDVNDSTEIGEEDEVEKYVLSLIEDGKKEESLQVKPSAKTLIPTRKKIPPTVLSEVVSGQDRTCELTKEKQTKRVHCVAEMRSLKFQKSMKVKDTNGEEAAYANLKAEIQRLTFNPNVSKGEVMKFLKEWRSEQLDRLHNDVKRLSSIEEFMKNIDKEVVPNNRTSSQGLKELDTKKCNYSWYNLFPTFSSKLNGISQLG